MKIKFLSYFLLLFSVTFSMCFAKPLPPGTGNSTPANILFLVDKSQSMHESASGKIPNAMRPPTDVSGRGDGNYFVSGVDESGIYYWDADKNKLKSDNNVFKGTKSRAHGFKNRKLGSPIQIEYHATTKRLYVLADQRDMSHGNQCKITHNGVAYNGGFIIYMFDTTKGQGVKTRSQVPEDHGYLYIQIKFQVTAKVVLEMTVRVKKIHLVCNQLQCQAKQLWLYTVTNYTLFLPKHLVKINSVGCISLI